MKNEEIFEEINKNHKTIYSDVILSNVIFYNPYGDTRNQTGIDKEVVLKNLKLVFIGQPAYFFEKAERFLIENFMFFKEAEILATRDIEDYFVFSLINSSEIFICYLLLNVQQISVFIHKDEVVENKITFSIENLKRRINLD